MSTIGRALAQARGLEPRQSVKQVNRLLSNSRFDAWELFSLWVTTVLDWTDFDRDDQATLCAYLLTNHGRATPLLWKTVKKTALGGQRNAVEDRVPTAAEGRHAAGVRVTVLADRGFGDTALYRLLGELGFDYVIRFRGNIIVEAEGGAIKAQAWLSRSGRAKRLVRPLVTRDRVEVPAVVVVRAARMKEPLCLATSLESPAADVIKAYGRRFTIEESFRDAKDGRFGLGLSAAPSARHSAPASSRPRGTARSGGRAAGALAAPASPPRRPVADLTPSGACVLPAHRVPGSRASPAARSCPVGMRARCPRAPRTPFRRSPAPCGTRSRCGSPSPSCTCGGSR